jgi:hypothetical protein
MSSDAPNHILVNMQLLHRNESCATRHVATRSPMPLRKQGVITRVVYKALQAHVFDSGTWQALGSVERRLANCMKPQLTIAKVIEASIISQNRHWARNFCRNFRLMVEGESDFGGYLLGVAVQVRACFTSDELR